MHAFVVPLEKKTVFKKQTKSEKELGIHRKADQFVLNAQKITGSKECLRELQNRFYHEVSSIFSLERGEPSEETHARNRRPSIRAEEKTFEKTMQSGIDLDLPEQKILETAKESVPKS